MMLERDHSHGSSERSHGFRRFGRLLNSAGILHQLPDTVQNRTLPLPLPGAATFPENSTGAGHMSASSSDVLPHILQS